MFRRSVLVPVSALVRLATLCLGLALLSACSGSGPVLSRVEREIQAVEAPTLCNADLSITVVDKRKNLTHGPIYLPTVSLPNQQTDARPPLADLHRSDIRGAIYRLTTEGARPYAVEVVVMEGEQAFSATMMAEKERVRTAVEVRIETDAGVATGQGSSELEAKSVDASRTSLEKLYRHALRYSTTVAFAEATRLLPDAKVGCDATHTAP